MNTGVVVRVELEDEEDDDEDDEDDEEFGTFS